MQRWSLALVGSFAFAFASGLGGTTEACAQEHVFKIATLAPEGSSWMNLFHEWAKNVESHSGGKIKLKFYAGGVSGDERDAVRKMKLGQLNGASVTGIGLGLINSEVRVLELPQFIRTYGELDYVRSHLDAEIRKKFEERGYVMISWGDVGPVHIFSNIPIHSMSDLAQTKLWEWGDDPLITTYFDQNHTRGVLLGVPDVLPSLQTGMVNACYGSPLSTLALQWYTKLKYMTSMTLSHAVGATVVLKKDFDKLSPEQQTQFMNDSHELERRVLQQIRADNDKALDSMKKAGLIVVDSPPAMVKEFETQALQIRSKLEPSVYSHEFRVKAEQLLADYRAGKK